MKLTNIMSSHDEFIDEHEKDFEKIVIDRNVDADILQRGLRIVEKFIRDRGLILYGGQAIDFALRLLGTKIYPDDAVPDYDMYSGDPVKDCYDLTDIFEKEGMGGARSVVAMYVRAMKNSVSERRAWIADIAYVPADIYPQLPYLTYKGMKFIHPHYQMVDLHQSLSAPFSNPAIGEPIFARYKKDIQRFGLMRKYYPLPDVDLKLIKTKPKEVFIRYTDEVLIMFPAYSAMYRKFREFEKMVVSKFPDLTAPDDVFEMNFSTNRSKIECDSYNGEFSIIHCDIPAYLARVVELTKLEPVNHEPFLNIIPKKTEFAYRDYNFTIYNTAGYLIGRSQFQIDDLNINVASIQFQMKLLLAHYLFEKDEQLKMVYLACYKGLMKMIKYAEQFFDRIRKLEDKKEFKKAVLNNPFMLPVSVYGCDNISERDQITININEKNLGRDSDFIPMPKGYKAGDPRPPPFDYQKSKFFRISGNVIP